MGNVVKNTSTDLLENLNMKNFPQQLLKNPTSIRWKTVSQIKSAFKGAWIEATAAKSTKWSKLSTQIRPSKWDITRIEVHPWGGTQHWWSYYGISTSSVWTLKIIDPATYFITPEKYPTTLIPYKWY